MDGPENIILSEASQTEKDKYYMIPPYKWSLKNNTKECIYKTETGSHKKNNLRLPKGKGIGGGIIWQDRTNRYKLLYTR